MHRTSPLASFVLLLVTQAAPGFTDTNSNSLDDEWEKAWNSGNLFPPAFDPQADPDGDGWKNLTESIAGTNPFDSRPPTGIILPEISAIPATYEPVPPGEPPAEPPPEDPNAPVVPVVPVVPSASTTPILLDPSVVTLTWPTIPGKTYRAHISDNLLTWAPASETFLGSGDPMSYQTEPLNTDGSIPGKLFWRIETADTDSDGDTLTDYEEHRRNLNAFSPDTDRDGIPDATDTAPLSNTLAANPDGDHGLPASLASGLIAKWDLESTFIAASQGPYYTLARYADSAGTNHIVPFHTETKAAGMPSKGAGTTAAAVGFLCPPRSLLHNRSTYAVSLWANVEKQSLTAARPKAVLFSHHRRLTRPAPYTNLYRIDINGVWIDRLANGTQVLRAGSYRYRNHYENTNTALPPGEIVDFFEGVTSAPQPAGFFDDGKYHHYAANRTSGTATLYRDGILIGTNTNTALAPINATNETAAGISLGRFYGEPAEDGMPFTDPLAAKAAFDRVRVWNRTLTAAEALALYRQDIDRDGLWDLTESATRLWRDTNSDATAQDSENSFSSSPFLWQPATHDIDQDGLTDTDEQTRGTGINNPDTDGDLIPDGFETAHNLDPLDPIGNNGATGDPDSDGLNNLGEYTNVGDPHNPNTDGGNPQHPDATNDGAEVSNGSSPNDPGDAGQPLPAAESLPILLGIGDQSGSHSEDYVMHIYRIDPATGAEVRHHTLRSGGFGQYREETLAKFRKGETYTFQIDWQGSNNNAKSATGGSPAEGPDFDYTFKVQPQGTYLGKLFPSYHPATGTTNGPSLAATGASDVAATQQEFEQNYESRRVALVAPKLEWQAIAGFDNLDTHIDPWSQTEEAKGKRIFPCRKNPNDKQLRHKLKLVATGGLKGVELFVKSFDIDDSTDETFDRDIVGVTVIDINTRAGDDNVLDYLDTASAGHFWNSATNKWGGSAAQKTFGVEGQAVFDYRVGMQPGNNYRAVASVGDATGYASVQVLNDTQAGYLGYEFGQNGGAIASEALTVWRRLWVENDSMEAIGTHEFGYLNNDLSWDLAPPLIRSVSYSPSTGYTSFGIDAISDQSSFLDLQNGSIIIQSVRHPVIDTASYAVYVAGNYSNVPLNSGFRLYDDDGYGLDSSPLPRNDLVNQQIKNYFKPSFIEITDAGAFNTNKRVPFHLNEDVATNLYGMSSTVVADARNLTDSLSLWVAPLTAAYQGPQDADRDPILSDEGIRHGETAAYGDYDHSTVFVEACRENYEPGLRSQNAQTVINNRRYLEKYISANAAHEIGHQPGVQSEGADHAELGLMAEQLDGVSAQTPENAKFAPGTVLRFRKSSRWSR